MDDGVASTMTNLDSMLYKLAAKKSDVLNLYADRFKNRMEGFEKGAINMVLDALFPEVDQFRDSSEGKEDYKRLHRHN